MNGNAPADLTVRLLDVLLPNEDLPVTCESPTSDSENIPDTSRNWRIQPCKWFKWYKFLTTEPTSGRSSLDHVSKAFAQSHRRGIFLHLLLHMNKVAEYPNKAVHLDVCQRHMSKTSKKNIEMYPFLQVYNRFRFHPLEEGPHQWASIIGPMPYMDRSYGLGASSCQHCDRSPWHPNPAQEPMQGEVVPQIVSNCEVYL